jgi:hypothetical protein
MDIKEHHGLGMIANTALPYYMENLVKGTQTAWKRDEKVTFAKHHLLAFAQAMDKDVLVKKGTHKATLYQLIGNYTGDISACRLGRTGYTVHQPQAGSTIYETPTLLANPTPKLGCLFKLL